MRGKDDDEAHAPTVAARDEELGDSVLSEMAQNLAGASSSWQGGISPEQRYEVGELLGNGGMASVYRATDKALGRVVALKFLRDENPLAIARFQREARAQARMDHPHICRVHEVGELRGRPFISMQYIAGSTLASVLGELSCEEKVALLRVVALAVQAAHEAGLIHRDLKPTNILVERSKDGVYKPFVTDFGIARESSEPGLTVTGEVLGTPQYMSPEQALGNKDAIGARSDVYALGATLYAALAGVPPFGGSSVSEVLVKVIAGDPPSLRGRDAAIPRALDTIVMRCLSAQAEARYPSAQALADDLGRFLAGEPLETRRPGALARLRKLVRRHRAASVAIASALVALAATAFGLARRAHSEWRPEVHDFGPVFEENGDGVVFSPDGSHSAYNSNRDGHSRVYVADAAGEHPRAVTPDDMWAHEMSGFSRDGASVFFWGNDGLYQVPVAGGAPTLFAKGGRYTESCGDRRVVLYDHSIALREANGSERELVKLPADRWPVEPSCDPPGKRLAYAVLGQGGAFAPMSIWLLSLDGGAPLELLPATSLNNYPVFHPDGKSLFFSSTRGGAINVWELPLDGGAPIQVTTGGGPDLFPRVSPDGQRLIFNVDMSSDPLYVLATDGSPPRRLSVQIEIVESIAVSPDGRELALSLLREGKTVILVRSPSDASERVLGEGRMPAWSSDGSEVFWVDASQRILASPRAGGAPRTVAQIAHVVLHLLPYEGTLYIHEEGASTQTVPMTGGVPRDLAPVAPGTVLIPFPGNVRAAVCDSCAQHIRLLPPGATLEDPRVRSLPNDLTTFARTDAAGRVYWVRGADVHRMDVTSGSDAVIGHVLGEHINKIQDAAVAPDGTLYYSARHGRIRHEIITNFADRPRPR
jgi:serine/threonine protein kinase/Tol biopolymer transport system component